MFVDIVGLNVVVGRVPASQLNQLAEQGYRSIRRMWDERPRQPDEAEASESGLRIRLGTLFVNLLECVVDDTHDGSYARAVGGLLECLMLFSQHQRDSELYGKWLDLAISIDIANFGASDAISGSPEDLARMANDRRAADESLLAILRCKDQKEIGVQLQVCIKAYKKVFDFKK